MGPFLAAIRRPLTLCLGIALLCLPLRAVPAAEAGGEADPAEVLLDQAGALMPDAAITTSLNDAFPHVPFLDAFDPRRLAPLARVPHGIGGQYALLPGLWETELQSYCLKPGTYLPERGDGYLGAPLKGPQADLLLKVLRGSLAHPELAQSDIQEVVLALVLRLEISQLPESSQQAARVLLSPEELARIDGFAFRRVGEFERLLGGPGASATPRALPKGLSQEARAQLLNSLARISAMLHAIRLSHAQMRWLINLEGPRPRAREPQVPAGAWSYHPAANGEPFGVFVRFFPEGYEATTLQVYVPEPLRFAVDAEGRVTAIADRHGWRVELEYAGEVPPLTFAGDPAVTGYALRAVRLFGLDAHDPRHARHAEYRDAGWVLLGVPNGQGQAAGGDRYPDAQARYAAAVALRDELNALLPKIEAVHPRRGPAEGTVAQNLLALAGVARAVKDVVEQAEAAEGSDLEPAPEAAGLCDRAWASCLAAWATGPDPGRAVPRAARATKGFSVWDWFQDNVITPKPLRFDPNTCLVPGVTSAQRLGLSGLSTSSGRKLETFKQAKRQMGWVGLFVKLAKPAAPATAGLPILQGILSADLSLYAVAGDIIANVDPPRDDFHLVAAPDAPPLPPLPAVPGWSAERLQAARALLEAAQALAASLRAAVLSYERHGGAVRAGNAEGAGRQLAAFLQNQRLSGERMLVLADRLDAWLEVLHRDEVPDTAAQPDEMQAARERVRAQGLPEDMAAAARQAGFTEEEIAACRDFYAGFDLEGNEEESTLYGRLADLAGALRLLGVELMAIRAVEPPPGRSIPAAP